jgi:DNA-binding NtrC family response regulator
MATQTTGLDPRAPGMPEAAQAILKALGGVHTPLRDLMRAVKWAYVETVMRDNQLNQSKAALALGMHRNTMSRTIDELGMREYLEELERKREGKGD